MTATKTSAAPPCSGEFRVNCVSCRRPTHPATASGPNRACADGHQPYVGKGRCRPCYQRDRRAGRLPKRSPIPRPRPRTAVVAIPKVAPVFELPPGWRPVPAELRDTTPAACARCDTITRLPFGPGDALCPACEHAEAVDMRGRLAVAS